jgi:hypothetical protein
MGTSRKRSAATAAVRVILEEGGLELANSVIGYTVSAVLWTISSALRSSCSNPGPWDSRLSPFPPTATHGPIPDPGSNKKQGEKW